MNFLKGKKTYFVAAAGVLAALGAYSGGEITLADMLQTTLLSVLGATLRNGMTQ